MKKYRLSGVDCPNCASFLQAELQKLPSVKEVLVDFSTNSVYLDTSDLEAVRKEASRIEEGAEILDWEEKQEFSYKKELAFLAFLCAMFFACVGVVEFGKEGLKNLAYVCLAGIYVLAGYPVIKGALRRLRRGEFFDENFLMLFATIAAFFVDAYLESVAVMLFFRIGEFFENLAVAKSKRNIASLLEVTPNFAYKKEGTELLKVLPQDLKIGDVIVVRAGEKVASDGEIILGESNIDQRALNGESAPVFLGVGSRVFGGSVSLDGMIEVRIDKPYAQSSIAQVVELVQNASSKKAHTEKLISAFAKIYTPIVFFFACALAIVPPLFGFGSFQDWVYKALVVLMVSCPCALVLSVPLGYFGGLGGASKQGVLIKGANYLEALAQVKRIAFDKTGTLTQGCFSVVEVCPSGAYSKEDLLHLASCAENLSTHPIAKAIQEAYKQINPQYLHQTQEHTQFGGLGVKVVCCGNEVVAGNAEMLQRLGITPPQTSHVGSVVHIVAKGEYVGYLILKDEPKPDTYEAIKELQTMGVEMMILSGDSQQVVDEVAKTLGISKAYGNLLPQDKLRIFQEFSAGHKSAFVGDGINDAPVLSSADVGISMGVMGSDLSKESADVVLVNDSLLKVPAAMQIAKKTKTIIMQNIAFALGVKGIFIILGIFGVASLWEAVFGDVGVALLALLNASRVLR